MTNLWDRARQLKGETLHTMSYSKAFDISDVRSDRIIFVPHDGNGTERWASREQIEYIATIGQAGKEITPGLVQAKYPNDRNTSYIAAIAQAIIKTE